MAIGLIMQAVGMAATLAGSIIDDKEIVTEYSSYNPDPVSFKDAGLYNNAVDLGEQKLETTKTESPGIKKSLLTVGSLFSGGGPLIEEASGIDKLSGGTQSSSPETSKGGLINTSAL